MNVDKRQLARTQGKFAGDLEKQHSGENERHRHSGESQRLQNPGENERNHDNISVDQRCNNLDENQRPHHTDKRQKRYYGDKNQWRNSGDRNQWRNGPDRNQGRYQTEENQRHHYSDVSNDHYQPRPNHGDRNPIKEQRKQYDSNYKQNRSSYSSPANDRSYRGRNDQFPKSEKKVKYVPNENYKFQGLETKIPAEEIKSAGMHILSDTEVGQSLVYYYPNFLDASLGYNLLTELQKNTDWHQKEVFVNGIWCNQPRLVAWYGPLPYSYSGTTLPPKEFPPEVMQIKLNVEQRLKQDGIEVELNSVLLNLYRDNKDSVAWHSDDELSMGICPTIASVSIGERRRFEMRRKSEKKLPKDYAEFVAHLKHGSLIVMDGVMQLEWEHRVPKEYHDRLPRINFTFRTVYAIDRVQRPVGRLEMLESAEIQSKSRAAICQEPFAFKEENFPSLGGSSNANVDGGSGKANDHSRNTTGATTKSKVTDRNSLQAKNRSCPHEEQEENTHYDGESKQESSPLRNEIDSPVSNFDPPSGVSDSFESNELPSNEETTDHPPRPSVGAVDKCSTRLDGHPAVDNRQICRPPELLKKARNLASMALSDSRVADRDKEELEFLIDLSKAGKLPVVVIRKLCCRVERLLMPFIDTMKLQE